jgi:pimeloyl-ACP methyl ester carboxylesterase
VVPLDYDHPDRGSITLALMRRSANDQAHRIGSLFLNPGGPGVSGYRLPTIPTRFLQQRVADRFDLIGFDPRGVARSTPLRCFLTEEDADAVFARLELLIPLTPQEERQTLDALRDYWGFCDRFAGPLLDEMSTKNVALDLDRLRAAVGDVTLNYVGLSYGTMIGATYVNLFPDRSRAIVLDANIDPDLRTHDGLEYMRQRAGGFELAVDAFLRRCAAAGTACAFSAGDPRAKYDELRAHLRGVGPITLPDGTVVTFETFVDAIVGAGVFQAAALAPMARALQELYDVLHPPAPVDTRAVRTLLGKPDVRPHLAQDTPYTGTDVNPAVSCTDEPYRIRPNQISPLADRWERQLPTFGRLYAWANPAGCVYAPLGHRDVYSGPWHRRTPNPVLLFGNFYDPATPFAFSERLAGELGNSRLVGVDAFGHTILGRSTCTGDIASTYLLELRLPGPGTVCQPDVQPF